MDPAHKPNRPAVTKRKAAIGSAWVVVDFGSDQVLRLVRNLLLTRLISKEMLGLLGLASIVVDLIANLSEMGVNLSIMRQRRENEQKFLDTAWTLAIFRGTCVWLVASAMAYPASLFYNEPKLLYAVPLLALGAVLTGAWSTKIATTNRDLKIAWVTSIKLAAKLIGLAATIGWALLAPDNLGVIIVGPLLAATVVLIASFVFLPGPNNRFAWDKESLEDLVKFGRWIFVSTIMTYLIRKGDLLTVGKLQGTAEFAVYSIAYQIGNMPPKFYQALHSKILFPIFADIKDKPIKVMRRRMFKVRLYLLLAFLPALWLLMFIGTWLIDLMYPDSYIEAGWMLELLAAGTTARLVCASAGGILLAKGNSFRFMIWKTGGGLIMLAGMIAGLYIGSRTSYPDGDLAGLIIGMGAGYWLNYPLLIWTVRGHDVWLPKLDLAFLGLSAVFIVLRYAVFA